MCLLARLSASKREREADALTEALAMALALALAGALAGAPAAACCPSLDGGGGLRVKCCGPCSCESGV